jgi:hypothetical protein
MTMMILIFMPASHHVRIEMAFGLMLKKWGILNYHSFKLSNIKYIVVKIDCINNVCINKQLTHHNQSNSCYNPGDVD